MQDKGTDTTNEDAAVNQTRSSPSRITTATNTKEQSSPETSQQDDDMNHASPSTQQPSPRTPNPIREARPQPAPTRQLFCQAATPTVTTAPVATATAPSIATDPPQVQFMGYSIPQNLTPYQRFLLQQAIQINHQPPTMPQNKLPVWPGAVTIVQAARPKPQVQTGCCPLNLEYHQRPKKTGRPPHNKDCPHRNVTKQVV